MIKRICRLFIAILFRWFEKIKAVFLNHATHPGACVVLMYHDVSEENSQRFAQQMNRLAQLAKPIGLDSIHMIKEGHRYAAVTFDDGFASTTQLVLPILLKKKIPVTFFIPVALLGKEAIWIEDAERRACVGPIITAESMRRLSQHNNVNIGSHGMNHRRLKNIDDASAQGELFESKRMLERMLNKEIKTHSFPFGEYEDRHITMAIEAGYNCVLTVDPTVKIGSSKEFVIGRVQVDPTDCPLEFDLKVLGAYRWLSYYSRLKGMLFR